MKESINLGCEVPCVKITLSSVSIDHPILRDDGNPESVPNIYVGWMWKKKLKFRFPIKELAHSPLKSWLDFSLDLELLLKAQIALVTRNTFYWLQLIDQLINHSLI